MGNNLCIYTIILVTRQSLCRPEIQKTIKTNIIPATSILLDRVIRTHLKELM